MANGDDREGERGGAKGSTMRIRTSVVEGGGASPQAASGFEAASTAARKR